MTAIKQCFLEPPPLIEIKWLSIAPLQQNAASLNTILDN